MKAYPERKNIRLLNFDYSSNGYYFITICAGNKRAFYNNKDFIREILCSLPLRFNGVSLDYSVVMGDHLHAILILNDSEKTVSEVVRQFKALITLKTKIKDVWQKGFFEHVIRNEKALQKIREYIRNNPLAEKIKFEQFYERAQ